MAFAENLLNARKRKGLSQEKLAEMLHVSRQAVSKWETGNPRQTWTTSSACAKRWAFPWMRFC